ncbi:MAG: ribonuclease E activity regulator RraA [Rhizobiales bacterium]|nr:ribonuclease E activity regulator RraA [Hyphomicrobiales bacterium]
MPKFATTDLSDAHPEVQHCEPVFGDYGAHESFHGPVTTLKCFEDNAKVREALEKPGQGRVLVVDGGGSLRCALFGGNLGKLAEVNGWAGVVINGCVRDTSELEECTIGVKALAAHPKKSDKQGVGYFDQPVTFAMVTIHPGDWLYADGDGVIISRTELR